MNDYLLHGILTFVAFMLGGITMALLVQASRRDDE